MSEKAQKPTPIEADIFNTSFDFIQFYYSKEPFLTNCIILFVIISVAVYFILPKILDHNLKKTELQVEDRKNILASKKNTKKTASHVTQKSTLKV